MPQPTTLYWYPWYTADWRGSRAVSAMTAEQRGIYRELLDYQWDEGSLPDDEEQLARIARATPKEWSRVWPVVRGKFADRGDGRLVNLKLGSIREAQTAKATANVERAIKAAHTRWGDAPGNAPSIPPSTTPRNPPSTTPSTPQGSAPSSSPLAREIQSSKDPEKSTSPAARPGALRGMESEETHPPAGAKSTGPDGPAYTRPSKVRTTPPEPVGFATLVQVAKAQRREHPTDDRGDLLERCKAFCAASGLRYDSTVLHKALDAVDHTGATA